MEELERIILQDLGLSITDSLKVTVPLAKNAKGRFKFDMKVAFNENKDGLLREDFEEKEAIEKIVILGKTLQITLNTKFLLKFFIELDITGCDKSVNENLDVQELVCNELDVKFISTLIINIHSGPVKVISSYEIADVIEWFGFENRVQIAAASPEPLKDKSIHNQIKSLEAYFHEVYQQKYPNLDPQKRSHDLTKATIILHCISGKELNFSPEEFKNSIYIIYTYSKLCSITSTSITTDWKDTLNPPQAIKGLLLFSLHFYSFYKQSFKSKNSLSEKYQLLYRFAKLVTTCSTNLRVKGFEKTEPWRFMFYSKLKQLMEFLLTDLNVPLIELM